MHNRFSLCSSLIPRGERIFFGVKLGKSLTTKGTEEHRGNLHLTPQLRSWVFRIQLRQLSQQFFSALVPRHGNRHRDLNNLVSPDSLSGGGRHSLLPQTQLLS